MNRIYGGNGKQLLTTQKPIKEYFVHLSFEASSLNNLHVAFRLKKNLVRIIHINVLVLRTMVEMSESPYFEVVEDLVGMALIVRYVVQRTVEVFAESVAACTRKGLKPKLGCMACNVQKRSRILGSLVEPLRCNQHLKVGHSH